MLNIVLIYMLCCARWIVRVRDRHTHIYFMYVDFTQIPNRWLLSGLACLHGSRWNDSAKTGPEHRFLRNSGSSTAQSPLFRTNGILRLFISLERDPDVCDSSSLSPDAAPSIQARSHLQSQQCSLSLLYTLPGPTSSIQDNLPSLRILIFFFFS